MSYKMIDYQCPECWHIEERLVHYSEIAKLIPKCVKCEAPMLRVLGVPSSEFGTHIIEHEDDSTRPSSRRGATGPLIKVQKDREPKGRVPGLGRDLGDGYYLPDRKVVPPWERGKK